jgi:hypothetical protein
MTSDALKESFMTSKPQSSGRGGRRLACQRRHAAHSGAQRHTDFAGTLRTGGVSGAPGQRQLSTPPGTGAAGSYGVRVKMNVVRSRWVAAPSASRPTLSVSPA